MEPKIKPIKTGDIIKTDAGIRLVVSVLDDKILLRPLDLGRDDAYPAPRTSPWTLLARGAWRCEPGAGWRHVR